MSDLGKELVDCLIACQITGVAGDQLENARVLGSLARVVTEESSTLANPTKLTEAALRCIDSVEILIEAIADGVGAEIQTDVSELRRMNRYMRSMRKELQEMRESILDGSEED
jgi:hypothetical protein